MDPQPTLAAMPAGALVAERDEAGRPTRPLPFAHLLAINAYWLAIATLWGAVLVICIPRLIDRVIGKDDPLAGSASAVLTGIGIVVAILVQPTIGAISDNTRSRLGRRKPYIVVGTLLDLVFLTVAAIAFLNADAWGWGAFALFALALALLQFSSNFAQGPYQGFVPDLVPTAQVGIASGMLGMANLVGNLAGAGLAVILLDKQLDLGIFIAVGLVELVTMAITVRYVRDTPGPATERTLLERAKAAWGADILEQRAYVWLLVSRLLVLMALSTLTLLGVLILGNAFGFGQDEAEARMIPILVAFGVSALLSTVPGGWISTRVGRKPVIYAAIAAGIASATLIGLTQEYALVVLFVVPMGVAFGVFSAVDWALMTDIIPKAESGRYMGLSNVVTGGSQAVAPVLAGVLTLLVASATGNNELAYRLVFALIIFEFVAGALTLTRVPEPLRRTIAPPPAETAAG